MPHAGGRRWSTFEDRSIAGTYYPAFTYIWGGIPDSMVLLQHRAFGANVNRGLYIVMGVSGSGKSVIGAAFARVLGVDFVEGDDYHSAANVERMSSGVPLTDDDRAQWLRSLAVRIREANDSGIGLIVSCSALKRSYRDILRAAASELRFVFLHGPRALLAERLAGRRGHYMPPSLLESQLATLEEPSPDEQAWVCDIRQSPEDIVAALMVRASA